MKTITTEIIINAKPEKVWTVLTDFEKYPSWNPFIQQIYGDKKVGSNLTTVLQQPGGKKMTFKPVVLEYLENKEFRWKGKLFVKGLFDGEHFFILSKYEDSKTKLIHGENFNGILVGVFGKMLDKTKQGFELMNKALKNECENKE